MIFIFYHLSIFVKQDQPSGHFVAPGEVGRKRARFGVVRATRGWPTAMEAPVVD
jgi:hypothetical protein